MTNEERKSEAAKRRNDLTAQGYCLNGKSHGPNTHGRLCAWCRLVHNKGLAVAVDLATKGQAPPIPPGYKCRPRTAPVLPLLAAVLGGCVGPARWYDVPTAQLRTESGIGDGSTAWLDDMTNNAIADWRSVMPADCATPFVLEPGPTAHVIRVVSVPNWTHGKMVTGMTVYSGSGLPYIELREDGPVRLVLLHELGHAMGLEHVTDRPSIMNPGDSIATDPTAEDGADAACSLGCGPCR